MASHLALDASSFLAHFFIPVYTTALNTMPTTTLNATLE